MAMLCPGVPQGLQPQWFLYTASQHTPTAPLSDVCLAVLVVCCNPPQGLQHVSSNGNGGPAYYQPRPAAMPQQCVQVIGPHGATLVPLAEYQAAAMARGGVGAGGRLLHTDPMTGLVLPATPGSSNGAPGGPQPQQTVVVLPNGQAQALVGVAEGGAYMGGAEVRN
jgi:hypothetical protein